MKHFSMGKGITADPTPNMYQQGTIAEQKLRSTEAQKQRIAKYERTNSGASRLAARTWRRWGLGSPLWCPTMGP